MAKISSEVLDALSNCKVSDGLLFIGGRLDRKIYTGLNKVLGMLGGKWNSKKGAYIVKQIEFKLFGYSFLQVRSWFFRDYNGDVLEFSTYASAFDWCNSRLDILAI